MIEKSCMHLNKDVNKDVFTCFYKLYLPAAGNTYGPMTGSNDKR